MFNFLHRKTGAAPATPVDVLGRVRTIPAAELIARLRAEYAEQVTA